VLAKEWRSFFRQPERSGDRGTRKLNPPSNENLKIAEDVAGVAGPQNAAPPWGFVL